MKTALFFDRLTRIKEWAMKNSRPIFHDGNMFTFDGLIQQGIEIADERARLAKRGAAARHGREDSDAQ